MKEQGLLRARKRRHREQAGGEPFTPRETRSYEVAHVHGLWHLDFHQGSRPVLTAAGQWQTPQLLGILDDRSRLCCHLQWYLDETAEALVHGLSQAFQKRGLPRALLTDNGSAMLAAETVEGLERLGVVHHTTLPYSPEQNGKQESFWGQVEGRLLPMLEGECSQPHRSVESGSGFEKRPRRPSWSPWASRVCGSGLFGRRLLLVPRAMLGVLVAPRLGVDIERVAVLGEAVDERAKARGVVEDRAPLLVGEIGREERPIAFHIDD